jgi:hypothetical protein
VRRSCRSPSCFGSSRFDRSLLSWPLGEQAPTSGGRPRGEGRVGLRTRTARCPPRGGAGWVGSRWLVLLFSLSLSLPLRSSPRWGSVTCGGRPLVRCPTSPAPPGRRWQRRRNGQAGRQAGSAHGRGELADPPMSAVGEKRDRSCGGGGVGVVGRASARRRGTFVRSFVRSFALPPHPRRAVPWSEALPVRTAHKSDPRLASPRLGQCRVSRSGLSEAGLR